jgi:ATP-dependent Lon protease
MGRDKQIKNSKSVKKTNGNKYEPKRRCNEESSSSSDESIYSDEESEVEMDQHEYRKFLQKIFPSTHLENKIKAGLRLKKSLNNTTDSDYEPSEDTEEEEEEEDSDYIPTKHSSKNKQKTSSKENTSGKEKSPSKNKPQNKNNQTKKDECKKNSKKYVKKNIVISDEEEESEDDEEESEEDEKKPNSDKFNIILTINGKSTQDVCDSDYDEDEDDDWETSSGVTENEDDPVSSDSETEEEEEENEVVTPVKNKLSSRNKVINKNVSDKIVSDKNVQKDLTTNTKINENDKDSTLIEALKELQSKHKDNNLINECIKVCEKKCEIDKKKMEKKVRKEKDRNTRIFKKILRDKNTMNDFEFYDKLDTTEQKSIIKELREINKVTRIEKPYRITLLESKIPVVFKATAMKKISSLRYMEPGSGEFYKIKNWVDTFMRIPFGEYRTLPISIADGVDKCHDFMYNAQKTLDEAVYGLNDAKMQIMQMLGQLITNPKAIGTAIAIHGPPGTGKTSLVKEGISKILDRPFTFIALGGATDSSFLEGHGYTYEGSMWGKIVQILIDSKCMNPVIYFDELDKISDTPKGEEIAGILTHLTDTSQNSQFHDKYFAEIDFDLSKCLFIFSYNDESKVNPILKDRMYRIQTKGYNQKQKMSISTNYLLPKIREQVKFENSEVIIPDQTLQYIIENNCLKEDGVRNLKRCLEIIYTKLNLYRLMRPGSNLFEEEMSLKVEFPFTVTKDVVDKLIKKTDTLNPSLYSLYI